MDYKDYLAEDAWIINSMSITDGQIDLIVGGSYISIFDVYKDKLNKADGVDLPTETIDATFK
jgi:hypothetical protein